MSNDEDEWNVDAVIIAVNEKFNIIMEEEWIDNNSNNVRTIDDEFVTNGNSINNSVNMHKSAKHDGQEFEGNEFTVVNNEQSVLYRTSS